MKKILITGATGFAGSFLTEELAKTEDVELTCTSYSDKSLQNIASVKDSVKVVKIDLLDSQAFEELLNDVQPDEIYHLAALPSPADSYNNPQLYIHNNVDVQLNLLETLKKNQSKARILIISSAEVYGAVSPKDLPIDEQTEFRPTNPYSVSKATQDLLALQYFLSYRMNIIRVRPFNHIGPRQSPDFVVSAFAKQIAGIEKGNAASLQVGNLEARRDFTDVRDMVKAYIRVMESGKPGEVYNIGRGESTSIQTVLDKLIKLAKTEIDVKVDPSRLRPSDTPDFVCDNKKIVELTGWHSEISLEQSLKDTLDYWRVIV